MENKVNLATWIQKFNNGNYDFEHISVQIEAGWYDWFCRDTSLVNKTKKMGNVIKQIKAGGKVDLETTYVWFKNNCPLSGPLYDDFRIADIETGDVQYTVQFGSPWEKHKYTVYGIKNVFQEPLFETDSLRELVKWFNEGWDL